MAEQRLIDANALMDAFRSYMVERYDKKKCVSEENCKTCENSCLWRKIVSVAPTVDAVEVVHAHWIEHKWAEEENGLLVSNFECSACHSWERNESNCCPNCGAKMDGGNENG